MQGDCDVKLGFTTLACPDWTLEQAVTAAAEYGYDGIELRLIDDQVITPELLATNRERIKRAKELGTPFIRVFGGKRPEGVSMEEAIANVAESLNNL